MFLLLSPGVLAVGVAIITRRSLAGLARLAVLWWPLGIGSFLVEFALSSTSLGREPSVRQWGSAVWLLALAGMLAMLIRNAVGRRGLTRAAWSLAALGVVLNVAVVAANGGRMPQSQAARIAAGASAAQVAGLATDGAWHNVAPMTLQTRFAWLGDILPEPAWLPLHNVMSIGDVLLATGFALVIFLSTTPESGHERRRAPALIPIQPRL